MNRPVELDGDVVVDLVDDGNALRTDHLPVTPAVARAAAPRTLAEAPPEPPKPPVGTRTIAGYPMADVALVARVAGAVALAILVAFASFALWVSGARFEAQQQAGFGAFSRFRPLVVDGTARAESWPRSTPVALVGIPKISRNLAVFAGADRATLTKGPGYDPTTAFPGEAGNTVIVGRSTSYGSPFGRVAELVVDDQVIVTTPAGTTAYRVVLSEATRRSDPRVTAAADASRLTFVTDRSFLPGDDRWVVQAEPVAGGIDQTIVEPTVKVPSSTSASIIELLAIGAIATALVVFARPFVVATAGRRAAIALLTPVFVTLGVPFVGQLALLLPRAF